MASMGQDSEKSQVNLSWLIMLRWGAITGQATAIAVTHYGLNFALPLAPLIIICALTLVTNIFFWYYAKRPTLHPATSGLVIALDVLLLTGMLYFTGGTTNPFAFLFLVHIALGAVMLSPPWSFCIVVLTVACMLPLTIFHVPLTLPAPTQPPLPGLSLHQRAMATAFLLAAVFVAYPIGRINKALSQREDELRRVAQAAMQAEKLTSLATLAAGAAHELATPLATIAVVAKELEYRLRSSSHDASNVEDAKLIRTQVDRCRNVLNQMAADAGQSRGEPFSTLSIDDLVDKALAGLTAPDRIHIIIDDASRAYTLDVPARSTSQALAAVLKNALEASTGVVTCSARVVKESWNVVVEDHGSGMSEDVRRRVGEPFFTTKGPGSGMGLGIFLTRTDLERLGGGLSISSQMGRGTTVLLRIPARPC